ncbi:MAG: CBS domain-containing protein [Terrimicrobiaceae bacterium]|nr:CBS domain-containing protein [Terrimicrobiaceae bacterium]
MPSPRKTAVPHERRTKDLAIDASAPVAGTDPLQTAGTRLRKEKSKSLPVVTGERVVGTIKGPNPEAGATRYGHDPAHVTVSVAMSKEAISIQEDQTAEEARELMNRHQLDQIAVVDSNGRFLGTLSRSSLPTADADDASPSPTRADVCPGTRAPRRRRQ